MKKRRTRWIGLGLLATMTGLLVVSAPTASANHGGHYDVAIGNFPSGSLPLESMRFFPGTLNVHSGDTITFTTDSFHSATLLPTGTDVQSWVDDNVRADGPFSLDNLDPDDGPNQSKFNFDAFFPTDPSCGESNDPCLHDGSAVTNSGLPLFDALNFTVEVTGSPGDVIWVVCLVHPQMRMRINIVDDTDPTTTPDEIADFTAEKVAQDLEWARAMHKKMLNRDSSRRVGGNRVFDAWVGVDNRHASLFDMYPHNLRIRKGDRVRWHFDALNLETHTVGMPRGKARQAANNDGVPMCDPDTDAGPGPDEPATPDPSAPLGVSCEAGQELEFDRSIQMVRGTGNGRVRSKTDFESSGERGPDVTVPPHKSALSYTLVFNRRSGDTPFRYLCQIHPFMQGRVTVR